MRLLLLVFISLGVLSAGKVKISKVGQADVYVPTYDADGKTLVVESVQGPGSVPVGGMVTVMPNIDVANTWQPPATGVIKDGFMRADGTTITSAHKGLGCKLAVGTVLPNMVQKYPRGNTTSGAAGGANTQASNVTIANHVFTQPSAHGITQPTFSVPAHYHGRGTLGASADGNTVNADSVMRPSGGAASSMKMVADDRWSDGNFYNWGSVTIPLSNHGHSVTLTGSIGATTGGSNGDAAFGASRTTDVALTNNHTGGGVDAHAVTNSAVNNEPAYVEVVWVIRVK